MPAGNQRPYGHQGLVDGDESGGNAPIGPIHPGFANTLAGLYAFGLSDNAVADNTLIGSYFKFFVDTEGALEIRQSPATSGADFDAHPGLTLNRHFTTFPSAAMQARFQAQYDMSDRTQGGSYFVWALANAAGASSDYASMLMDFRTQGAIGYVPNALPSGPYTEFRLELANRHGFGTTTRWVENSDGLAFRQALFDPTTPQFFYGDIVSMVSGTTGGNVPATGSAFAYTIAGPMGGPDVPGKFALASFVGFLDQLDNPHGEAVGHAEIWTTPAPLGSAHQKVVSFDLPQSTFVSSLNTTGDLGADGDLDIIGDADVGGLITHANYAYVADNVDFTVAVGGIPCVPNKPGFIFVFERALVGYRTGSGTATGSLIISVGNDGAEGNIMGPQTVNAAAINTSIATGFVGPFIGAFFGIGTVSGVMAAGAATLKVRTAITGVTALTGWFTIFGHWIPV